jgi:glucose-1-phosphate adenylyltransferase
MKTSEVAGLIFANSEGKLKRLTAKRSTASVPFGARYRIVDFALSNLVNYGVSSVGIVTNENYRSLMDHVGSGISWDLDRKNGGVFFLPPYFKRGVGRFNTSISSLAGATDYIERSGAKYIVLYDSEIIANVDISVACKQHINLNADITVVYHTGKLPAESSEKMILKIDDDKRVRGISFAETEGEATFGIGVTIVNKDLLLEMIQDAIEQGISNFEHAVLANKTRELKMYGFEHKEYVAIMDNTATYYEANMDLLNADVRKQLFNSDRPVLTKVHDGMPTRYSIKSKVNNSLVADNCIIEGTVKNSIIFRNVKIGKGAVVENSILMQGTVVGEDATLDHVIADKNTTIGKGLTHKGTKENLCFFEKNQTF